MVDFIKKRLQVFVSSTYEDLKDERQAAVTAILSTGNIPAGMELFTAGDESQMEVIKQWIDQSDVFLLILGGRYGSIEPTSGKSYTHLEYEYALKRSIPSFACMIRDEAVDARVLEKKDTKLKEQENPKKWREFREFVSTKLHKPWSDSKDIQLAIHGKLNELSRRDDLVGWIKADQQANTTALADEIARLSEENADLRAQLSKTEGRQDFNGLTFEELLLSLKRTHRSLIFRTTFQK